MVRCQQRFGQISRSFVARNDMLEQLPITKNSNAEVNNYMSYAVQDPKGFRHQFQAEI